MITLLRADPRAGSVEPATAIVRPDTLTDQDAARIAATIDAARTESTRRVYAYTWGQWARWCAARELSALPDDPAALCAYLTERAAAGLAITSIDGACTAIRHVHRMQGMDDPVASEIVRQVRLGLRRTYGTAHPRPRRRPGRHPDHRPLLRAGHATPPPRWAESRSLGSPRRPGTVTSPSWSTATSAPSKRWLPPRAETSDYDRALRATAQPHPPATLAALVLVLPLSRLHRHQSGGMRRPSSCWLS
jgi:hypothetical protein